MIFCPDLIDLLASIASASTVRSSASTFLSSLSICLTRHSVLQDLLASCARALEWIAETPSAQHAPVAKSASRSDFFMVINLVIRLIIGFPLVDRVATEIGRGFRRQIFAIRQ